MRTSPRSDRLAVSARRKSSGVVSFMLPASPAKVATFMPGPFGERGVVGEIVARGFVARGGARRRSRQRRTPAASARRATAARSSVPVTMPLRVDGLDRVGDRQHRHRRAVFRRRGDRAGDQRGRRERPRCVVDQHDVGLAGGERLQPGADRILPGRAAEYRRTAAGTRPMERSKVSWSSGWMTGCTSAISRCPENIASERSIAVPPGIRRYCLGTPPPARMPRPAATTTAATVPAIF